MRRFADLYAQLDASAATGAKLAAMRAYFADPAVADEDKTWALWLLLGHRLKRLIPPTRLRQWIGEATGHSPTLIEEAYSQVGDLAETIALLIDTTRADRPSGGDEGSLSQWVERLRALAGAPEAQQREQVLAAWQALPRDTGYLFNKLLTGSLRVGVSAGLAARALAEAAGLEATLVTQRLMGDWTPSATHWASLLTPPGVGRSEAAQPYPFYLASPLEDVPESLGGPSEFLVEWKWDGIRAQLIRREGGTWLWSRGEELLNGRFPEIEALAAQLPDGTVLDGEILAWQDERPLAFAVLQKRIGRKTVGKKMLADAPVTLLAYDLLEWQSEDLRSHLLAERRAQLEALAATLPALRLSPRVIASDWSALATERERARELGVEGLMLKRLDSPYLGGRKRGAWWKWKVGALTVDTVLIYAQAGHGRRANLYTDYTLAVWHEGSLVPVAKAYSGLTDVELLAMDRWIRAHTREKFGPVRSVDPLQVFEIAFEGIQASPRHKAGVALRFPRIARWRQDKPAAEADTLDSLKALLKS